MKYLILLMALGLAGCEEGQTVEPHLVQPSCVLICNSHVSEGGIMILRRP